MTFGLFANEAAAKIENARLNPLDTSEPPSALTGIARGVGLGLMRGGAKAGEAMILAATVPNVVIDNLAGTRTADPWFSLLHETDPVEYWTPDPRDVGTAGQVLGGLAEIALPLAAGGGSPNLLLATTQLTEAKRLVDAGVDAEIAGVVGAQQALGLGVGFRIPFFGRNFIERTLIAGAGVNLAQGVLSRGWSYETLKSAGYQTIADQYDPMNFEAAAIDALTGVAFGTIAHLGAPKDVADKPAPELTTEQTDALLTANAAKHLEVDHAPGALDPVARTTHVEAITTAVDQLARGEKVNVAGIAERMKVESDRWLAQRRTAWAAEVGAELRKMGGDQPKAPVIPRSPSLNAADQAVESRFIEILQNDLDGSIERYKADNRLGEAIVLNTDNARELSPDYAASKDSRSLLSAAVHEPASWLVKQIYARELARPAGPNQVNQVVFTGGGTGAGKSTGLDLVPNVEQSQIIYDTNMNGLRSASEKIEQALAAGKEVVIAYVHRDPVDALVNGALPRAMRMGRAVPLKEHAKTHLGARQTIEQLVEKYRDDERVQIQIIDNTRGRGKAASITDPDQGLAVVRQTAYNDLEGRLLEALEGERQNGRVSEVVYRGTAGDAAQATRRTDGEGNGREHQPPGDRAAEGEAQAGQGQADAQVVTERGTEVAVRYRLAEASDLTTSHDNDLNVNPRFPAELQPRDRSRQASEAQIARIENDIRPELLGENPKASDGAPIMGPDAVVESGNARTIALRRAYAGGKAERYRQWLVDNARRFGLDPAEVAAMREPVLVRERLTDVNRAEFARQANEAAQARISVPEQAKADAARLNSLDGLVANDDGTISVANSQAFIRRFMTDVVSPGEQGAMIGPGGALSQEGLARIRNAIFAKAYGDADVVSLMAESLDANVKNILGGLMRVAPVMARMRDFMEAGVLVADLDLAPDLAWAVRTFSQLRAEGRKTVDFQAQQTLFPDPDVTPARINLLTAFEENSRSAKRVADLLSRYERMVQSVGNPNQAALFGAAEVPTRANLLADAIEGVRADYDVKATGSLFDASGDSPEVANAKQVIAENPELRIVDENGNELSAVEALKRADEEIQQAAQDAKGFEAAVNCLVVNA